MCDEQLRQPVLSSFALEIANVELAQTFATGTYASVKAIR